MNTYRGSRTLAVLALCAVAAAGCGSGPLPAEQVSSMIVTQLKGQGVTVDNDAVTCPGDLPVEVGRTVRCAFTAGGQPVDALAEVSSVEGGAVNFEVRTEAKPVPRQVLERTVLEQFVKAGIPAERVACAGVLEPGVGRTQTCTLVGGGTEQPLVTEVTEVRDGLVNFSIRRA